MRCNFQNCPTSFSSKLHHLRVGSYLESSCSSGAFDRKIEKFQDTARKFFSPAYLPVNEISKALAYYQEEIQEKINSCEKIGKIFDYVWIFWILGPIPMDLWNVFDRHKITILSLVMLWGLMH